MFGPSRWYYRPVATFSERQNALQIVDRRQPPAHQCWPVRLLGHQALLLLLFSGPLLVKTTMERIYADTPRRLHRKLQRQQLAALLLDSTAEVMDTAMVQIMKETAWKDSFLARLTGQLRRHLTKFQLELHQASQRYLSLAHLAKLGGWLCSNYWNLQKAI